MKAIKTILFGIALILFAFFYMQCIQKGVTQSAFAEISAIIGIIFAIVGFFRKVD